MDVMGVYTERDKKWVFCHINFIGEFLNSPLKNIAFFVRGENIEFFEIILISLS